MAESTLFERIGGRDAVNAAVELFYQKLLADDQLRPFFDGVDMDRQQAHQRLFMTYAFGGAPNYPGRSMQEAHRRLVEEKGLNDTHFDAVAGHLKGTLEELNVPSELVLEVLQIVGSTREAVLNRVPVSD